MRAIKVWGLAQIINFLPALFFARLAINYVVIYGVFSFIGGLPVLMAFAINDLMINNMRTGKQTYFNVLLLWPIFTAIGALFIGSLFVDMSITAESGPIILIAPTSTVISLIRYRRLFLEDSTIDQE